MKGFKLLEWIRKNTDRDHPMTQDALRKAMGKELSDCIMGDKGTYARRLRELADAYNTDEDGNLLPKDKWKIVYPGYAREKDSEGAFRSVKKNGKVYYSHPVSSDELDFLISSVRNTGNYTKSEKESLEERLIEALASRHYAYPETAPCENIWDWDGIMPREDSGDVPSDEEAHQEQMISLLRSYIIKKKMADLYVESEEAPEGSRGTEVYQVSPYRIIRQGGICFLIANYHERPPETYPYPNGSREYYRYDRKAPWYVNELTAFRIDRIRKIKDGRTPDQTYIHWAMNINIRQSGPRLNAGNVRKARYPEEIRDRLSKLEELKGKIRFEHLKDIDLSSR